MQHAARFAAHEARSMQHAQHAGSCSSHSSNAQPGSWAQACPKVSRATSQQQAAIAMGAAECIDISLVIVLEVGSHDLQQLWQQIWVRSCRLPVQVLPQHRHQPPGLDGHRPASVQGVRAGAATQAWQQLHTADCSSSMMFG
jgi:hypothetical protein